MTPARRLIDDCFLHDRDRLSHDAALALLAERITPVADIEGVPLAQAHGRILARDILSPRDVPAFANAAVDGYAFAHASLDPQRDTRLRLAGRIAAGHGSARPLRPGEAVRIFTGAPMPAGADTCIMQEDARREGKAVVVPAGVKARINTRNAGEDLKAGEAVAKAGQRLRPQEIAALASIGLSAVPCRTRLRAALVSTGDEVVRPGTPLASGQVFDSNHYLLRALLATVDAEVVDCGILPDDRARVDTAIRAAARDTQVILTTGGASRGEADHMVEAIRELGTLHAWQLAIKPGRPLAFGQIGDTVCLGLPGNPVAAFVCFLLYAQPVFAHLQGALWRAPRRYPLPAGFALRKKAGRREFWRGWIEEAGGHPTLRKFPRDGSGLITGLRQAQGLIEAPEELTAIAPGDPLGFIPFTEFGLPPN